MLCHVEFAINSTIAESVGRSPFELVYGEQVRLPVHAIVGHQSGNSTAVNFVSTFSSLFRRLKIILREPKSTKSATSTSTTDFRSIW